jgi:hypothetical protein
MLRELPVFSKGCSEKAEVREHREAVSQLRKELLFIMLRNLDFILRVVGSHWRITVREKA